MVEELSGGSRPLHILIGVAHSAEEALLSSILQSRGHQLHLVESGHLVLGLVQSRAFDLIILDARLKSSSALGTARLIRMRPHLRQLPILGLLPQGAPQLISDSLQAGMSGILTLPLQAEPLLTWIASYTLAPLMMEKNVYSG